MRKSEIRQKLITFMYGRYGNDTLNKAIYAVAIVIYIIGLFCRTVILSGIALGLVIFCTYRMFSRNIYRRQRENYKFLLYFNYYKLKWAERKTHHVYICKGCKKYVRYPKGRGKIEVTCKACGAKRIRRS